MKNISYETTNDMINDLIKYDTDWNVVCHFEYAAELVELLICNGYLIAHVDLCDPAICGYDEEYYVTVVDQDIFCKRVKYNDKYVTISDQVSFVHENCNSAILNHIESNVSFMYSIAEYDEDEDDSSNIMEYNKGILSYTKDNNGDLHGFSYSKSDQNNYYSYSYYSTDNLNMNDIEHMISNVIN